MSRRKKITLSIVFAFGSLSCIISIIRLQSIIVYLKAGSADLTNDLMNIVIWSYVYSLLYWQPSKLTVHVGKSRSAWAWYVHACQL